LLVWNENLDNPTVGGTWYVKAMETRMRLTNGRTITYALGLEVAEYDGVREVSHSGSTAGYRTFLARYPDQHVSVAVWCNYAGANPTALSHQVVDLVLVKPPGPAAQAGAPAAHLTKEEIARWQGKYRDRFSDQMIALTATDDGLSMPGGRGGRGGTTAAAPIGTTRFQAPVGQLSFSGTTPLRTFVLVRPDGDTAKFEEVRSTLPTLPVADYTGTYASDELDVRFTIALKDGKLVLRRRPADEIELRPVYADDF